MELNNSHFEEVKTFIRENRSNEQNFSILLDKLKEEIEHSSGDKNYLASLTSLQEKYASTYLTQKEKTGTAWNEFERFVGEWEKILTEESK